jgi:serine phosphatase RsbU (regulator of sigma subunit)
MMKYNVVYSNASHQKAILLRTDTGEVELLDTNGLFIGAIEEARSSYEEKITKLITATESSCTPMYTRGS